MNPHRLIEPTGRILVHYQWSEETKTRHLRWEWQGGDIIEVNGSILHDDSICRMDGRYLLIGPYRLRVIDQWFWSDSVIAILDSPRAGWVIARYNALKQIDYIYRYSIWCLSRLHLAHIPGGAYPTWRDIVGLDWLATRLGYPKVDPMEAIQKYIDDLNHKLTKSNDST